MTGNLTTPIRGPEMLEEQPQQRQSRTGTTWTEEENEQVVALVRSGADLDAVADGVRRSSTSVVARLRRMLPLEHRSCPNDRVVLALREHLRDPDYDWQGQMLLTLPPRPVVNPPAIVREGLAGLADDDLVTVAHSVLLDDRVATADLRGRLVAEVKQRGLADRVGQSHESYLATHRELTGFRDLDEQVHRWSKAVGLTVHRNPYAWADGPW
ncbi:hypothetical protein [Promicromonospora iranensis]|uniref:hypothetical protein n=1 Tax=Promicromonospora iranensis TaxID=1105144 RepID=UPI0023A98B0A|nr:hypothetical protein [Promicromonospora iranensis]